MFDHFQVFSKASAGCLALSQVHCPIYLVNVSSMSAGDVVATAKMQGKDNDTALKCAWMYPGVWAALTQRSLMIGALSTSFVVETF